MVRTAPRRRSRQYQALIRRHVELTQQLAGWIAADDRFEIVAPHPLNLVCLRLHDDAATERLIEAANATRRAWFTRTVLDGHPVLRFSIGSRATEQRHVAEAWQLLHSELGYRSRLSRSTRTCAVAPQTVSSSSSKK